MNDNLIDPQEQGKPSGNLRSQKTKQSLLDTVTQAGGVAPAEALVKPKKVTAARAQRKDQGWLVPFLGWIVALVAVAGAVYVWQTRPEPVRVVAAVEPAARPVNTPITIEAPPESITLPELNTIEMLSSIDRKPLARTNIPTRSRTEAFVYVVDQGDAIFSIADQFNITPETVLWANYDLLNDNPDFLELGMALNIPPVNGVYYEWQEGDTFESVAEEFEAEAEDILEFSGNNFDLSNPFVEAGSMVMVPDGKREFRQWLIPTIARGNAGVNSAALGPGACTGSYSGAFGSGAFIWPTNNHTLSGNDYWSGHLGIDIGAVQGDPIYSSDAGVVVFSGWANGGYGYTVVVDHGNGYQSLYAHNSSVSQPCGTSVGAGTVIARAGSTGNSTGTHLHFEVRLSGGFINPWFVLPPP